MGRPSEAAANRGWQIFSKRATAMTRDEINEALHEVMLPPISVRMFDHYHRLQRHDVREYMPINEFDISLKNGLLDKKSA